MHMIMFICDTTEFLMSSTETWTQGLAQTRQVLYHWTTSPALKLNMYEVRDVIVPWNETVVYKLVKDKWTKIFSVWLPYFFLKM